MLLSDEVRGETTFTVDCGLVLAESAVDGRRMENIRTMMKARQELVHMSYRCMTKVYPRTHRLAQQTFRVERFLKSRSQLYRMRKWQSRAGK